MSEINESRQKQALAYIRVPSMKTDIGRKSYFKQLAMIVRYARENGIELVGICPETAKSPTNMQRRGVQNLLRAARRDSQNIDYVLVYDIGRLSRNPQDFYVGIMSKLRPLGITVRSATQEFDDTPGGQFEQLMYLSLEQFRNEGHKMTMLKRQATV